MNNIAEPKFIKCIVIWVQLTHYMKIEKNLFTGYQAWLIYAKTCPTTHYIPVDFLEQVVLGEICLLTKYASRYEDEFAKVIMGQSQQTAANEQKPGRKELDAMTARDRELDTLFERIYEDNVAGKISDERFAKMS